MDKPKKSTTFNEATKEPTRSEAKEEHTIPLQQALRNYYSTKDKLPANIDGRQLPIVEVQLSLVESVREKNKHNEIKQDQDDKNKNSAKKEIADDKTSDKAQAPSILEREENDSLRYYEDWHNVKEETIAVNKIFGEGDNYSSQVLVLGPAGIGKTTLSQYIAHAWSKQNFWPHFKYVFWLPLRNLGKEKYKVHKVTLAQVLYENCLGPLQQKQVTVTDIQHVLTPSSESSQTLMVLDGFDEVAPHLGTEDEPTHIKTLFDEACKIGQVILTSRPYQLAPELLSRFPRQLENRGFNDAQIKAYVTSYFMTLNSPRTELVKNLLQWLKNNSRLTGMSHVPVNLSLLCTVWNERDDNVTAAFPLDMSLTALYQEIVNYLLKRYLQERKGIVDARKKDTAWVREHCKRELHFLSYLAYRGLIEKKIHLHGRWVENILGDWKKSYAQSDLSFEDVLSLGFLSTLETNTAEEVVKQDINKTHYFLHLSFQEYFAAEHLLESLATGKNYRPHWETSTFISNEKYNPRYAMVFTFAAGLTHLDKTTTLPTQELWTLFLAPPIDMTGLGHLRLVLRCLNEANFDARIPHVHELEQQLQQGFATTIERYLDKDEEETRRLITRDWIPHLSIKISKIIEPALNKLLAVIQQPKSLFKDHEKYIDKKKRALRLLRDLGEVAMREDFIIALRRILEDEKSEFVNLVAIEVLRSISKNTIREDVIAILIKVAMDDHRDSSVTCKALYGLAEIAERDARDDIITAFVKCLKRKYPIEVCRVAAAALGNMSEKAAREDAINALFDALKNDNLGFIPAAVLYNMAEKTARGDIIVTLKSLGYDKQENTADANTTLLKFLDDDDANVRGRAVYTLRFMSDEMAREDVIAALIKVALSDSDQEIRITAISTLSRISKKTVNETVIAALIKILGDSNWDIKREAIEALYIMDDKAIRENIIPVLAKALDDNAKKDITTIFVEALENKEIDAYVRVVVARALGKMGEKAAREDVIIALTQTMIKNRFVSYAAADALDKMGEIVRERTIQFLITTLKKRPVLDLDLAFDIRDERSTAARALGKFGKKQVREDIIQALIKPLINRPVIDFFNDECVLRGAVAEAFVEMGELIARGDVLCALLKLLEDPNNKSTAIKTLNNFSLHKTLINCKSLSHWSHEPRSLAILSLLQGIPWVMKENELELVLYTAKATEIIRGASKPWLKALADAAKKRAQARGLPYASCLPKKETQVLEQYLSTATSLQPAPQLVFSSVKVITKDDLEKFGKQLEQKQEEQTQHLSVKLDGLRNTTEAIQENTGVIRHQNEQILSTVTRIETTIETIAAEQQKQIQAWQILLAEFTTHKQTILKEITAEKTATHQPKRLFDKPLVQQFYETFKKSLDDFYALAQLIADGKVAPESGKTGKVISFIRQAGDLIPVPYIPLAVGLLCSAADSANKHNKKKEAQESVLFLSSTLSDHVAKEIARRYQRQIESLTEKGVTQLAACACERAIEYMTSLNAKDLSYVVQTDDKKITLLVAGVIQGNPFTLKNTAIEVRDKTKQKNWRAEGLFKRSGLELSDGSRYIALAETTQFHFWQKKQKKSPLATHLMPGTELPKYGYRFGQRSERVHYRFNYQTQAPQKASQESKDEFADFKAQAFYECLQSFLEAHYLKNKLTVEGKLKPRSLLTDVSIDLLQEFKAFDFLSSQVSGEIQSHFGIDVSDKLEAATSQAQDKLTTILKSKIDEREVVKAKPCFEVLNELATPLAKAITTQYQQQINELSSENIKPVVCYFHDIIISAIEKHWAQDSNFSKLDTTQRTQILMQEICKVCPKRYTP